MEAQFLFFKQTYFTDIKRHHKAYIWIQKRLHDNMQNGVVLVFLTSVSLKQDNEP